MKNVMIAAAVAAALSQLPAAAQAASPNDLAEIREQLQGLMQRVDKLEAFVGQARDLRLGWGRFEDDVEVIYFYDRGDGNFGYALNLMIDGCSLMIDGCSEWGYTPFD